MQADTHYQNLIHDLLQRGDRLITRNAPVYSLVDAPRIIFTEFPLVTFRSTAALKAIREMEWFLSGEPKCPDELLDWWEGQLCEEYNNGRIEQYYYYGYGEQFRDFGGNRFDQISHISSNVKSHPFSRRNVITAWNPADMETIAHSNNNPNTPATCHGTLIQCFVRDSQLHLSHYQRSADVLLGVPHNWVQYWAFLLWLCAQTGYKPGSLIWTFGDLHLYDDPTHIEIARLIVDAPIRESNRRLVYAGKVGAEFRVADFVIEGERLEPVTNLRPRRF